MTNWCTETHQNEWDVSKQSGCSCCNHPATWQTGNTKILLHFFFFFRLLSAAQLLNYKSKSLGMLTIQYNMTLAPLSKKCLTKQCKQQLQLWFFFSLSPPLLSHSHLLPQMMYSMLHWDIHMEQLEDFRLKLIFLPLGSGKSQKLLLAHLWNRFSLLTLKAIW